MLLSDKQRSFVAHSDAFINIADGAVRSGKTHGAMIRFAEMCALGPPGDLFVVGKTERTIKRNVVYPLTEGLPKGAVRYVQGSGELYVFGRRCWIIGANDARAEEKARGLTAAGGYINEWSLVPQEVTEQLIDRCSVIGAQILGDTNPDSPFHYLYANFLSAGLPRRDLKRWRFGLNDNPVLHEEYKERLKRLHTGLWYRRMVEGEWVVAEGAIYPMLDPEAGGNHVVTRLPDAFERYVVGVDYATATVTVFLLLGKHRGTWYVIREYYHDAERTGTQKTNTELRDDFLGFLGGVVPVSVEVDPSAAGFQLELRRAGVRRVNDADNEVVEGIRRVSTALSVEDRLKIHASCQNLLSEMSGYVWDKKAQERGEDKPVKKKDHGPDALRYAIARIYGKQPQRSLRLVR